MPFSSIIAEPHDLAKLTAAYDAAWMGVNSVETVGAQSQKRARQRLAAILIELWREDPDQPLAARAVERFFAPDGPRHCAARPFLFGTWPQDRRIAM